MPILYQKWILRVDLRSNPDVRYLFGDNELRTGYGGQAKEMRGEPNAIGIATKARPDMGLGAFWSDADYERHVVQIATDLQPAITHLIEGGILVIPADGLGTGFSDLPARAPRVFAYLEKALEDMKSAERALTSLS